jgi:predicted enzyme related to lactoylglutathione lyase
MTTDADAALKFYKEVFHWELGPGDGHGRDGPST